MKFCFATFLLLIATIAAGQNIWLRDAGGAPSEEITDLAANNTELFSTGFFSQTVNIFGTPLTSAGGSDVLVMKTGTDGSPVWTKRFGGPFNDRGTAIAADGVGNSYVAGTFRGTATFGAFSFTSQSADSSDVFVMKLSPDGNVTWAATCGGVNADEVNGISVDGFGNVAITGKFRGQSSFGASSLVSSNYWNSSIPSADAYIAKLDSNGQWLWVKKATSDGDNSGIDVDFDANGDIFWTGTFSDTLTIDNTQVLNFTEAGFVVKLNDAGAEQWFRYHNAAQLTVGRVRTSNDGHVYVAGSLVGQLALWNNGPQIFPLSYQNNAYVLKYTTNGSFVWQFQRGSESPLGVQGLSIGPSGELYLGGTFNCMFDELAEQEGEGSYFSTGYRDIFAFRISSAGQLSWNRHFGGPKDDYLYGLDVVGSNQVYVGGSYSGFLSIPRGDDFITFPENNLNLGEYDQFDEFELGLSACADPASILWLTVESASLASNTRDLFITCIYNASQPEYNVYTYDFACDESVVEHCIAEIGVFTDCADVIVGCELAAFAFKQKTHYPGIFGPAIDTTMSAGLFYNPYLNTFSTEEEGWYYMTVDYEDGCLSYVDSVFIQIEDGLNEPTFTVVGGDVPPTDELLLNSCGPASYTVDLDICSNCDIMWLGDQSPGDFPQVFSGNSSYSGIVTDENGCTYTISLSVTQSSYLPLDTIPLEAFVYFNDQYYGPNDTITVCAAADLFLDIVDNTYDSGYYATASWDVFINDIQTQNNVGNWEYSYVVTESGYYSFTTDPIIGYQNFCDSVRIEYPTLSTGVYVEVLSVDFFEINPSIPNPSICPGDTLEISFSGAQQFSFYPISTDFELLNDTTILVWNPGNVGVFASSVVEGSDCVLSLTEIYSIGEEESSPIEVAPGNAIICPGEVVSLVAPDGYEYNWVGPLNGQDPTSQSLTVTEPGMYYCVYVSENNCLFETSQVEVLEYSLPSLIAFPEAISCTDDPILLQLFTISPNSVEWLPPLSGSSVSIEVTESGTYSVSSETCGITTILDVLVQFSDLDVQLDAFPPVLCPDESVELTASGNATSYLWEDLGLTETAVWVDTPGTYTLLAEDELGCQITESISVAFTTANTPQTADVVACIGDDVSLSPSGAPTFNWYEDQSGNVLITSSDVLLLSDVQSAQTIFVSGTDGYCESSLIPIDISINPASFPPIVSGSDTSCVGGTASFSAQQVDGVTMTWSGPLGFNFVGNEVFLDDLSLFNAGWYTVTINGECGEVSAQQLLIVESVPTFLIQGEELFCEGDALILSVPNLSGAMNWSTPTGTIVSDNSLIIDELLPENSGTYAVTVIDAACDYQVVPKEIEVVPTPIVNLSNVEPYCLVSSFVYQLPDDFDFYLWSDGSTENEFFPDAPGEYWVEVGVEPGCFARDSLYITEISCEGGFFNIITPNGDGINDGLDFGLHPANFEVILIYNRWGTLVRHLSGNRLVWNGRDDSGVLLNDGTYFWIGQGGLKEDSGTVMLISGGQ